MGKILLVALICALTLGVVLSAPFLLQYTHMDQPCDPDEKCPLHPDAVCKLDCLFVDADGKGNDCIYHFYDKQENLMDCWM